MAAGRCDRASESQTVVAGNPMRHLARGSAPAGQAFGGVAKGIKATFDRVDSVGKKVTITFSAMYDGKDYKYNGPDADSIMLTHPDPYTLDAILKRNGHVVQRTHSVISPDGQTRTQTVTGTNVQGQKINNVVVLDRQSPPT